MTTPDDLNTALRLFANIRQARMALIGLDDPSPIVRSRMIADPFVYKALCELFDLTSQLVASSQETALLLYPERKPSTEPERRFDAMREHLSPPAVDPEDQRVADLFARKDRS